MYNVKLARCYDGKLSIFTNPFGERIYYSYDGWNWSHFEKQANSCKVINAGNYGGLLNVFCLTDNGEIFINRQLDTKDLYRWSGWSGLPGGGNWLDLAIHTNLDGRMEVFTIGMNNKIYHNSQKKSGVFWSDGMKELPGNGKAKQIKVERNANGRLEIFVIGLDGAINYNCQTARISTSSIHTDALSIGPWEKYKILDQGNGQYVIQTINGYHLTAVNGGGRAEDAIHTDAKWIGKDEKYRLIELGDGWKALQTVNGNYLTAVNGGGKTEDVLHTDATVIGPWEKFKLTELGDGYYAITTVNGNYLTALDGGGITTNLYEDAWWSGWNSLGGVAVQLLVTHNADGRLEVFHIGDDKHIYHKWQTTPNGEWIDKWQLLGTRKDEANHIESGINTDGRIEIITDGTDKGIYHFSQEVPNGSWSSEKRIGTGDDEAISLSVGMQTNGKLRVVTQGTNNKLYYFEQNSSGSKDWSYEKAYGLPEDVDYVPPKPKPKVTVPNVINMTLKAASQLLKAYQLHCNLFNPGFYDSDKVIVTSQSPNAGSQTEVDDTIWLTVADMVAPKGFKKFTVVNQSSYAKLILYLWSSATNTWTSKGELTSGSSISISFSSNEYYALFAYLPGFTPPNDRAYWEQYGIRGDSNGIEQLYTIR